MSKYIKLILLVTLMMLVMCGCNPIVELAINIKGNTEGHFIDMLIPIGESDEIWTDFAPTEETYYSYSYDSLADVTPGSEIVKYSENGFYSMLMHMKNVRYENTEPHFDFEDKSALTDFCKKYGKFRLAEIDSDGNICRVTDTYSLMSGKFHHIKSIDYNSESGEVRVTYNADEKFCEYMICAALISAAVDIILLAMALGIALFSRRSFADNRLCAVVCGVCGVPALLFTLLLIYDSFMSMSSFYAAAVDFATESLLSAALLICIPLVSFIIFFRRYRKEKREEKL